MDRFNPFLYAVLRTAGVQSISTDGLKRGLQVVFVFDIAPCFRTADRVAVEELWPSLILVYRVR